MSMVGPAPVPRYVFDTNVLISALLFSRSTPRRALEYAFEHGRILTAGALLQELRQVLDSSKFDRYATMDERREFSDRLDIEGTPTTITVELQVVRDPKDNFVLELAVSGGANVIISGDADLLALRQYDGIPIRTPAQFLAEQDQF